MAYEEVTSPILTDATGQDIVNKLEEIAQNLQPPTNIDASDVSYDNTQSGMTATDAQGAIDEIKSNLTNLTAYDTGDTSSPVSVNGTYQIPADVLAHTFIIFSARRQGVGNSTLFVKDDLLLFDNGFSMMVDNSNYYKFKCSTAGLVTLIAKTNGVSDPFIHVVGIF